MGLLMGADGMGAIVGSIGIASLSTIKHHGRFFLGGSAIGLVMCFGFALSNSFAMAMSVLALLGLGTAGFATMQATIVLLAARAEMRGRALGVISVAIGAAPIGTLIIGALADRVGAETAVLAFATVGLVSIALVTVLLPQLRGQIAADQDAATGEAARSATAKAS